MAGLAREGSFGGRFASIGSRSLSSRISLRRRGEADIASPRGGAFMQRPARRVNAIKPSGMQTMVQREKIAPESTVDPEDVARFDRLSDEWWRPDGPMAALHKFNPVRVAYLRDLLSRHFTVDGRPRDRHGPEPLAGLRVLDIGCGAGILAEPLARHGAVVTAIDPAPPEYRSREGSRRSGGPQNQLSLRDRRGAERRGRGFRRRPRDGGARACARRTRLLASRRRDDAARRRARRRDAQQNLQKLRLCDRRGRICAALGAARHA
ncbi:protein of unknown function [Methylocella tundrae]|uniref:Uncharacterized protein n=1 Tax=Methylocella tundrae TaxID=227605 RepID=A0A4U8Z4R9_METTU|nr:protein of unknown function [Methylocella tundrae]